ncbi:MAG: hypothetical protein IPG54_02145 [Sphingomonadales bacterium]|nr:hypothetical protein [Sphingomonadales bacterium]
MESLPDALGSPAGLPKIFGRPLLFHQIKQLERLGVTDIVVAVDTVPAELPPLVDRLSNAACKVRLMRQTSEPSDIPEFAGDFLLVASEIWVGDGLLTEALEWERNSIAILPEEPANLRFERIDLSRRWAGLAVLDRAAMAHIAKMPEGWSLGSFLLRHALQTGAGEVAIEQSQITGGALRKISGPDDLADAAGNMVIQGDEAGAIEAALGGVSRGLIYPLTRHPWLVAAAIWSPLLLSLVTAAFAYFGYTGSALLALLFVPGLEVVRGQLRAVEYQNGQMDYARIVGFCALGMAVLLVLRNEGASIVDATFMMAMLAGLLLLARHAPESRIIRTISPLSIGLLMLLGWTSMPFLIAIKLIIAGMLGMHLLARWETKPKQAQLKSN